MTEQTLQIIAIIKLFLIAGFASLYSFGGLAGTKKAWRRWVAPTLLIGGLCIIHFHWLYLLCYALLVASLHIGYGESSSIQRLTNNSYLTRFIYSLAFGVSAIPLAFISGNWLILGIHIGLSALVGVALGVSSTVTARYEESIIGMGLVMLIPFIGG